MEKANPFAHLERQIEVDGKTYKYFSIPGLEDKRIELLPYSIRVLLESAIRNCDEFSIQSK